MSEMKSTVTEMRTFNGFSNGVAMAEKESVYSRFLNRNLQN